MKTKTFLEPSIDLQNFLADQLYNSLRGDVVIPLYVESEGAIFSQRQHDVLEGESLKVTKNTLNDIYEAFNEVKTALNFTENTDLYIVCDAEVNASSRRSADDKYPHVIQLQSALVKLLSRDELKFVIGHEMGHLINCDTTIRALHNFIYRDENEDKMPEYIRWRKYIYDQLSELSADRYGYIACNDIEASITALYKITSGLDLRQLKVKISGLMAENEERLKVFMEDNGEMFGDHPVLPIRVHALNFYANAKTQEELDEEVIKIVSCYYHGTEQGELFTKFVAAAGLYVANLDGKITDDERTQIITRIGDNELFPVDFLENIEKEKNIKKLFDETVEALKDYPDMNGQMMRYFVDVALADKEFTSEEMNAVFEFGAYLGYNKSEIADYIGSVIRDTCVPKVL